MMSIVEHLVNRITRRVVSEVLNTSDMPQRIHDAYIASSDAIDSQLAKLTGVVEGLAADVGSPGLATNIVKALSSSAVNSKSGANIGPETLQFRMSRPARSVFEQLPHDVAGELVDDIEYIVATLSTVMTAAPTGSSSDVLTIIAGHLDDYIFGHVG
jgi:hypothetical protein